MKKKKNWIRFLAHAGLLYRLMGSSSISYIGWWDPLVFLVVIILWWEMTADRRYKSTIMANMFHLSRKYAKHTQNIISLSFPELGLLTKNVMQQLWGIKNRLKSQLILVHMDVKMQSATKTDWSLGLLLHVEWTKDCTSFSYWLFLSWMWNILLHTYPHAGREISSLSVGM